MIGCSLDEFEREVVKATGLGGLQHEMRSSFLCGVSSALLWATLATDPDVDRARAAHFLTTLHDEALALVRATQAEVCR